MLTLPYELFYSGFILPHKRPKRIRNVTVNIGFCTRLLKIST